MNISETAEIPDIQDIDGRCRRFHLNVFEIPVSCSMP